MAAKIPSQANHGGLPITNQINRLLVPLALCLLAGCGKPEVTTPGSNEPASQGATHEKLHTSAMPQHDSELVDWSKNACLAMQQAGPGSMRATLRDHGMDEGAINIAFGDNGEDEIYKDMTSISMEDCGLSLLYAMAMWRNLNSW